MTSRIKNKDMNSTHFKGDMAHYTGRVVSLHGGTFYEVVLVEGHMTGHAKLVTAAPRVDEDADDAQNFFPGTEGTHYAGKRLS